MSRTLNNARMPSLEDKHIAREEEAEKEREKAKKKKSKKKKS